MKRTMGLVGLGLLALLACRGNPVPVGVHAMHGYGRYYGYPWHGYYYGHYPVYPDIDIDEPIAVPLPETDLPDFGMPDVGAIPFD